MAIYHLSMQIISRSKGQSAVAAASYRSGDALEDERTGETKYYVREVQPDTVILAPSNAPEWVYNRGILWNEVERAEKRKDAQLAREMNIALPRELSNDHQKKLIQNYIQNEFVNKGMIADVAIHRDDKENPHAHVMVTTRKITADGFGPKNRDWNNKELLTQWREQWAAYANKALEREGVQERISHLSHEARGLEQLPTVHLGHVAHEMENRGIQSDRGNINREVKEHNAIIIDLQKYREERAAILKRRQEQPALKQERSFYRSDERLAIDKAEKVVKGKVTLSSIQEYRTELVNWKDQIEQDSGSLNQKGQYFEGVKEELSWINAIETRIQEQQMIIKNAGFFEKKVKANARAEITRLESNLEYRKECLKPNLKNLGIDNKESFTFELKAFEKTRSELSKKFTAERKEISRQTTILDDAEKSLKQGKIREITSYYPELASAGQYMTYQNALKLNEINQKAGGIVPLEHIKAEIARRNKMIEERTNSLNAFKKQRQNVSVAETYFKELKTVEQRIEKIENTPYQINKIRFEEKRQGTIFEKKQPSKIKQAYDQAKVTRDQYKLALKNLGYENKESFIKHKAKIEKYEPKLPVAEKQIQNIQNGARSGISQGLIEGAIRGIEQAQQREQWEQRKQAEKQRYRGKKRKQKENGMER